MLVFGYVYVYLFIPETKGRSLEEMDVIFGTVSAAEHAAKVQESEKNIDHDLNDTRSVRSVENKDSLRNV